MLVLNEAQLRSQGEAQQEVLQFLALLIVVHRISLEEVTKQGVVEVGVHHAVLREAERRVQVQQPQADRLAQYLLEMVAEVLVEEEVRSQIEDQFKVEQLGVVVVIVISVHEIV